MRVFLCIIENKEKQLLIYFIGPGGAGKTTIANLISKKFKFICCDLDYYFMQTEGDISQYIHMNGYRKYALRNIQLFKELQAQFDINKITIIVCSSGFMTYPENLDQNYHELKGEIENHIFTFLVLPSLDLEMCVQTILSRQMNRTYLNPVIESEELKIRARFKIYTGFKCRAVLTDRSPDIVADNFIKIFGDLLLEKKK